MLYFLSWTMIIVGLIIISLITFRKFGILANIDLENIQAEKHAQVKNKLVAEKLKRQFDEFFDNIANKIAPFFSAIKNFCSQQFSKLLSVKHNYKQQADFKVDQNFENKEDKIETLLLEAAELVAKKSFEEAEAKCIVVISLDSHNFKAFDLLADIYQELGNYQTAKETLEHTIKLKLQAQQAGNQDILDHEIARGYFLLATICEKNSETDLVLSYLKKALAIEPNNPRYLDRIIELSIIKQDKITAFEACKQLEEVNPDNNKLEEFKNKIREL